MKISSETVADLIAYIAERRKRMGYYRPVKVQVPKRILEQIKLWHRNLDGPTEELTTD